MPELFKKTLFLTLSLILLLFTYSYADEYEFATLEKQFENFIRCELTRTNAVSHFKGQPFQITMVDLFDIQSESDLQIVTGAVQCFVKKSYHRLYVAVGIKKIMEKSQVVFYTIRKKDFSILATELIKYPYKERCKWSEYWIDID